MHEAEHGMHQSHHHHHPPHGGYLLAPSATVPPPCYNDVTLSSPNVEGHSASSGRGSAEDEDDVDEEIRMIIEGNDYYGLDNDCNERDSSVPTTAEYLARLGVVDHTEEEIINNDLHSREEDDVMSEVDLKTVQGGPGRTAQMFSSVRSSRDHAKGHHKSRRHRSHSQRDPDDWPSVAGSMSSIAPTQEELFEAYNWDYLQNWGPKYQPLSAVFAEIAKLKGATIDTQQSQGSQSISGQANISGLYGLDSSAFQSRLETGSTISSSTINSAHQRHLAAKLGSQSHLTSSNPLIQASVTSAFSPVRPSNNGEQAV
jgi:hypothetical protein